MNAEHVRNALSLYLNRRGFKAGGSFELSELYDLPQRLFHFGMSVKVLNDGVHGLTVYAPTENGEQIRMKLWVNVADGNEGKTPSDRDYNYEWETTAAWTYGTVEDLLRAIDTGDYGIGEQYI